MGFGSVKNQKAAVKIDGGFLGFGADERSRTPDLRITNALLYQLSYIGIGQDCIRAGFDIF